MSVIDPAPQYPIDEHLRLLLAAQPGPAPAQTAPGFLDRLAAGLANIQAPAGGRAGDQFGANLLAGAGRAFGGNRVAQRDAEFKRQMDEFERGKVAKGAETQAKLAALGKGYDLKADVYKSQASRAPEKPSTDITVTPEMAATQPELKEWVGRAVPRDWMKPEKGKSAYDTALGNMTPEQRIAYEGRVAESRSSGIKRGNPGAGQKPPSVEMGKVKLFAARATEASNLASQGGLEDRVLNKAWSLQQPPAMQSDPDVRAYWRAMESFGLALNRLESGASIAPTEFARVRQLYFVAPGDKLADIRAKALLRQNIIKELAAIQGNGGQPDAAAPAEPDVDAAYNQYLQLYGGGQ